MSRYLIGVDNEEVHHFSSARKLVSRLRRMHTSAGKTAVKPLVAVWDNNGRGTMFVGIGHPTGVYLACTYMDETHDLLSIAGAGPFGRRRFVEFSFDGNPHTTLIQTLIPPDTAMDAVTVFLETESLSLQVRWMSIQGMYEKPITTRRA